ncbi:MAG: pantetheine-phosphate adenylyltransferase [Armatimonadetes bacterium]|nr:pantetheine-phosphate adenylyltransferase [Armatimonadota bacterium]
MRVAVYPGSFDPPTLGHLDIIERGERLFDRLIVGIGVNSNKRMFLEYEERKRALEACLEGRPKVEVQIFQGLLVDFCRENGANAIIRGLRAISDFDYEFQISTANRKLAPEIETVMFMTKWDYSFISSSVVREVARLGGEYQQFVPGKVSEIIEAKLRS